MRFLIQRVTQASVSVEGDLVAEIGRGLLVLAGIASFDTSADADYLTEKLIHLRVFADEAGRMNRSAMETSAGILVVSQFTLYGDCTRGRRPGFDLAAPPDKALELYEYLVTRIRATGLLTRTGVFRAHMTVALINDGPVTFLLESPRKAL